ncbi:hypothetical protein HJC23_006085 [Cyclotella cryptica]|uniref:MACPF domain-containing protein n=1 Tax=Cyclotella cryptica TaxID=29204 RepID=A0ABD3QKV6_9STRA
MRNSQVDFLTALALSTKAAICAVGGSPFRHVNSQLSSSLRHRHLTALRCDSVSNNTCFIDTPRPFPSNVEIFPSSLLDRNGTAVSDSVKNLVIRSSVTCDALNCQMIFREFKHLQIGGSLLGSDITIEVETLHVLEGGTLGGEALGYVAGQGPSFGSVCSTIVYCYDFNYDAPLGGYGAGHGGRGGYDSSYTNSELARKEYGIKEEPTDFGSGGTNSNGGGKIYIMATLEVMVNGILSENGGDCTETTYCTSASGGSIYIKSPAVLGNGYITANGGSLAEKSSSQLVATGAGGRIAVYHNTLSQTLTIEVAGGAIDDEMVDFIQGKTGSYYTECLSSVCFNGGVKTGDCGCKCVAPWVGPDCSFCPLECSNGGSLNKESCSCSCQPEWTGNDCSKCSDAFLCNSHGVCSFPQQSSTDLSVDVSFSCDCNDGFYGDSCDTNCVSATTCSGRGSCSEDGKSCECAEGKAGFDCFCDAADCSAANACSGNGECMNSTCSCIEGFVGCDCSFPCLAEDNCSGNGSCNRDGMCTCKDGFSGTNCTEQDIASYCSDPENTVSGLPCLPLINDRLGYGMNAVDGKITIPILRILYTEGRTKTIQGKNYELPDNVDCEEVTSSDVNFSTEGYESASIYRNELLKEFGLSAAQKNRYMSASSYYADIVQEVQQKKKKLYQSDLVHGRFVCRFHNQMQPRLSTDVQSYVSSLTGNHLIERVGTHYIHEVTIGGRIRVFNFVSSCVFEKMAENAVEKEIEASVYAIAASEESKGGVTTVGVNGAEGSSTETVCNVFSTNTNFEKIVDGGKREFLSNPSAESAKDLKAWFNSLADEPGTIKITLNDIFYLLPLMVEDLDAYMESIAMQGEQEVDENYTSTCECVSSEAEPPPPPPEIDWKIILVVAEGILLVICFGINYFCIRRSKKCSNETYSNDC